MMSILVINYHDCEKGTVTVSQEQYLLACLEKLLAWVHGQVRKDAAEYKTVKENSIGRSLRQEVSSNSKRVPGASAMAIIHARLIYHSSWIG